MGMKHARKRTSLVLAVSVALAATSGCAQMKKPNESQLEAKQVKKGQLHILKAIPQGEEARISIVKLNDKSYVAAQAVADILEYRTFWDMDSLTMKLGVNDPEFELKAEKKKALKEASPINLSAPPIYEKDALYIPVEAVGELFGNDMTYRSTDTELTVTPTEMRADKKEISAPAEKDKKDELSFEDDPAYKPGQASAKRQPIKLHHTRAISSAQSEEAQPVALNVDELEALARRYIGINYKFGSGVFAQTGMFDCSSFTQHLFDKQKIELPRSARAQARLGETVDRKMLRPGDLLFFFVPGRFRSNGVVSHVGLYVGDGKMIHAAPAPEEGVQETEINQPYWKKTFIRAARISGSGAL